MKEKVIHLEIVKLAGNPELVSYPKYVSYVIRSIKYYFPILQLNGVTRRNT